MRWFAFLFALSLLCSCAGGIEKRKAHYVEQGKRDFAQKNYVGAISAYMKAIEIAPKDADLQYQLGLVYLGQGFRHEAARAFSAAVDLDPGRVEYKLKLAELLTSSGNHDDVRKARGIAESAAGLAPDNSDAMSTLALTEWRLGADQDAENHLQQAIATAPAELKSYLRLAGMQLQKGDLREAENTLLEMVHHAPGSAEAAVGMGRFYMVRARIDDAEREFRRAVAAQPAYGPALADLAAVQELKGRNDLAEESYRALAALPEAEYKPRHAAFLLQIGRPREAVPEWETLVKRNGGNESLTLGLVAAYDAVGRRGDALKLIKSTLERSPHNVGALFQRACLYAESGNYGLAESDLTEVLRARPGMAAAHYVMGRVREAQGMPSSRDREFRESVRLAPAFLHARLELAQSLIQAKDAPRAMQIIEETPAWQKQNLAVIVERNWALVSLEDWPHLEKNIEAALAGATTSDLLLQQGLLRLARKDYPAADQSFEKALALAPGDVRILKAIVSSYERRGQSRDGLNRVQTHAGRHLESAPVQAYLGELLVSAGDFTGARNALATAEAADPGNRALDVSLASLDLLQGHTQEARNRVGSAVSREVAPSKDATSVGGKLVMAEIEQKSGNYAAAVRYYREALDMDANNARALNNTAYLLAEMMDRPSEALVFAQRAKSLFPNDPNVNDTLGWIYYRLNLYKMALTYLTASGQTTAVQKYHVAIAYLRLGDMQRGRAALNEALRADRNLPEAAVAQRLLVAGEAAVSSRAGAIPPVSGSSR